MATPTTETKSAVPAAPAKRDFRQEVTDRIVNMLEEGVASWQKPWNPGEASVGMPLMGRDARFCGPKMTL